MNRAVAPLITAVLLLVAGCGSSRDPGIDTSASVWLSKQIAVARDAASHQRYEEAIVAIQAIEGSIGALRADRSISDSRARELLVATHQALLAVTSLTTMSTASTTPTTASTTTSTLRGKQPPGPPEQHGHKHRQNGNSD